MKIDRTLNKRKYITFLNIYRLPDRTGDEIFGHDRSPFYISHVRKGFLTDEDITVLQDWLAKRLDLNVIKLMLRENRKEV